MDDLIKSFFLLIAIAGSLALAQIAGILMLPGILVIGLVSFFSSKK